jgi:uncharacterized SAM-binding protein YcdF (DUF218 family)
MSPTGEQKRRLIWLRWIALSLSLLLVAAVVLAAFPERLMCVESGEVRGDVLVVLGGGSGERTRRAAELFAQGVAPKIIVTGDGDCHSNRRLLVAGGVPREAIVLECESRTTRENAEFTIRLLRESDFGLPQNTPLTPAPFPSDGAREWPSTLGPRPSTPSVPLRVVLVTSWYHSRRALSCFEHYAPEMKVFSRPAYYGYARAPDAGLELDHARRSAEEQRLRDERRAVAGDVRSEYVKILGYWVRYGIAPW